MNPKEYSASEAKRLLDELGPYFAELERRAIEDIVRIPSWNRWADRKRRCLADRINVIREVQAQLHSIIAVGKQSARVSRVA
ncbi:MAG TPA: hypothetical protein VNG33_03260 [Polyangiaceae bacterium]|nr:hypothetical protein [Polyangiaceae bacterium]